METTQWTNKNSKQIHVSYTKHGKTHATKSWLVLALLLIGKESGASSFNQSQSIIWQSQSKRKLLWSRVFNKGRQLVKLASYSTWTHHLFDWEITSYFMTNMRNIRHKTQALDRPRSIQEEQKNLAYILSNFSGDLCLVFCSNTLILAPECRKCILRVPKTP